METHEWLQMLGLIFQAEALVFGLILSFPIMAKWITASNILDRGANGGCFGTIVLMVLAMASLSVANMVAVGSPPLWVYTAFFVGSLIPIAMVFTHVDPEELKNSLGGAISFLGFGAAIQLAAFVMKMNQARV